MLTAERCHCLVVCNLLQDLHEFAYKSLDLARTTPQVVQDKLLRVLTTLNSETDQQQQQQQPQQQQQQTQKQTAKQATSGLPAANDDAGQLPAEDIGEEPGSTDPTAADCASSSPASPTAAEAAGGRVFSMSEVAAAARLDRQWLLMAADSLESRLLGIRDELGVSAGRSTGPAVGGSSRAGSTHTCPEMHDISYCASCVIYMAGVQCTSWTEEGRAGHARRPAG